MTTEELGDVVGSNRVDPLQLIQAKFYQPHASIGLIERPYLLARLDDGLNHKLILVSAPAGAGKTTLVSQWLSGPGLPVAWVSLDEGDNHPPRFLRYICAAVDRRVPGACAALQGLLTTIHLPGVDHLGDLLVEEMNALPAELILVLDDYHHISSSAVHQLMRHFLYYMPPRLHLVIVTRSDPPLYLGRMRARQEIAEIRAADLRFDLAETRRFFQKHADQPLDEGLIQTLQARTEGWIIGLQLASISLQRQSPAQFLAHFGGSDRLLAGYLVEEVMTGLPASVTEFLTKTALVDRFCAALGDALLVDSAWPASSHTIIEQLEAQNLFVVPLDDEGNWYRYHDLFRDFLLHRLKHEQGEAGLADLHWRASEWLAHEGMVEDALRHALAAGNEVGAAEMVEINLHPLLNRRIPVPVLTRWLDLFPEQVIQAHAGLLIAQIFLFSLRWDMAAISASIDRATWLAQEDRSVTDERRQLRLAVTDVLRAHLLYRQGDAPHAIPLFERGLNNLREPAVYSFVHAQVIQFLALSYAECGRREEGLALLQTALAEATAYQRPTMMILLGSRIQIHLFSGELSEAADIAEHLLTVAESSQAHAVWSGEGTIELWRGWAHHFLALIAYERDELEAATRHWQAVEAMRHRVNPGAYQAGLIGLALIALAQRATTTALAYGQAAHEFALKIRSSPFFVSAGALEMRLALAADPNPNWTPLTDHLQSLSIGLDALALDPIDGSGQTVIAGTGRFSGYANRGDDLVGIYYTTDGDANWTISTSPLLSAARITGVAARGNTLLAASEDGLFRTTGGPLGTWTKISGGGQRPA